MTTKTIWDQLVEPFPADVVKSRQGPKQHEGACQKQYGQCQQRHMMLSYVDARDVAERLDAVLTPAGWDFEAKAVPATNVVHGMLRIRADDDAHVWREDHGYPNSDDDAEPLKSATSDALKRCAVMFGIGRHLYDDNHPIRPASRPAQAPTRPVAAVPAVSAGDEPPWPVEAATAVVQSIFPDAVETGSCPDHNKPFKSGAKGWYCSTPIEKDGERVAKWCQQRPSKAWQAAQELTA